MFCHSKLSSHNYRFLTNSANDSNIKKHGVHDQHIHTKQRISETASSKCKTAKVPETEVS